MGKNTSHYRVTTFTCSIMNIIIVLQLFKILLLLLLIYVLIIKIILKLISRERFPHLETPNAKKTSIISSTLTPLEE